MGKRRKRSNATVCIGILAVLLWGMTGCSGMKTWPSAGTDSAAENRKDTEPAPSYYDFGDVLIPSELELDRKASFIFKTPSLTAGVLSLSGRVDVSSLIQFFETNMNKDNWQPVSSFKSVRTIMLYKKENRWCVFNISESGFKTQVEIWVAPTHEAAATGGLIKESTL